MCVGVSKQDEVDKMLLEDEKLLEAFYSTQNRPERTLAQILIEKSKEQNAKVSSGFILSF